MMNACGVSSEMTDQERLAMPIFFAPKYSLAHCSVKRRMNRKTNSAQSEPWGSFDEDEFMSL